MKAHTALIIAGGLLYAGAAFGQTRQPAPEWQSVQVVQTHDPAFPPQLYAKSITRGDARLAINTDAKGKLVEWLVVGYSRPEFAQAAVEAIKQWAFVPARMRGEPVGTTFEIYFYFEAKGVVVSMSPIEVLELQQNTIFGGDYTAYRTCSMKELDRIPTPMVTVAPEYPAELAQKGVRGKVTVDFYIDESGTVRMPSVPPLDNSELVELAVKALRQWKFGVPTRDGKPVLVKASQSFNFGKTD